MPASMFDRYGGFATVHKVVLAFYDKLIDSEVAGPYFDDVDLPVLVDHQTKFMSQVMGGPVTYSNDILDQVHRGLHISQAAFDEMSEILRQTLAEFGVAPEDVQAIMDDIRSRQPYIVSTD